MEHLDSTTIAAWIAALATLGTAWIMIHYRKADDGAAVVDARIRPIADDVKRHEKAHEEHYARALDSDKSIAGIERQLEDHSKHDDERFERNEKMLKEIRDDIKTLLSR